MLNFFMDTLQELFSDITYQFINPKKRIFLFYLLSSFIIAFLWLFFNKKLSVKKSLNKNFNPKIFFSQSSKSDCKIFFVNQIIMFFISPALITQLTIATLLFYYFHSISWLNAGMFSGVDVIFITTMFTVIHFILDDFSKYFVHRLMHKWHILWALHKVCLLYTSPSPRD